jgi:glucokinase
MRFLAGDVGGTKTNLALIERLGDEERVLRSTSLASKDYPGLEAALEDFLPQPEEIASAAFGVAGPVLDGVVELTNLTWKIDSKKLAHTLGAPVRLMNDLEANAHGIFELGPESFHCLHGSWPPSPGPAALLSAGTGLGTALLPYVGGSHHPQACEGGHTNFAPGSEEEVELLIFLRQRFGHATWEHVLSGPGLGNLYDFQLQRLKREPSPEVIRARSGESGEDPNALISRLAAGEQDPAAIQALQLFVALYGSAAGNLALTSLSRGGIFVGGGIAPKILPTLKEGTFLARFQDKPPYQKLLASIPVYVLLDPGAALLGARRVARSLGVAT